MQILWYDYETSGHDAAADRPVQLGWQVTDPGMEPIADAKSLLVRLPDDVLRKIINAHFRWRDEHDKMMVYYMGLAKRDERLIPTKHL